MMFSSSSFSSLAPFNCKSADAIKKKGGKKYRQYKYHNNNNNNKRPAD
jgi:hypothetical protein